MRCPKRLKLQFLVLVSVGIVLFPLGVLLTQSRERPGVTWSNIKRIKVGMTEAEVEAILGTEGFPIDTPAFGGKGWYKESGWLVIYYDAQGKVREKGWWPEREPTTFEKCKRWLGF